MCINSSRKDIRSEKVTQTISCEVGLKVENMCSVYVLANARYEWSSPHLVIRREREIWGSWGKVLGFPGGSDIKESACSAGDQGSIPGLGRCSGEGNGNPLKYSCLENPVDRGAWWVMVHGVTNSRTLSD